MDQLTAALLDRKLELVDVVTDELLDTYRRHATTAGVDVARFLDEATPLLEGAVVATVRDVEAWSAEYARTYGLDAPAFVDDDTLLRAVRNGTTAPDRLARTTGRLARRAVGGFYVPSSGDPIALADAAADVLRELVATDVQQMYRLAMRDAGTALGVPGFRRVLRGTTNCPLCVAASARTYRMATLMPIHPGCDCGVDPIPPGGQLAAAAGSIREDAAAGVPRYHDGELSTVVLDDDALDMLEEPAEVDHLELGQLLAKPGATRTQPDGWAPPDVDRFGLGDLLTDVARTASVADSPF